LQVRGKWPPYNVEISEPSEKAFETIEAEWPQIVDALDALWALLEIDPRSAGYPLLETDGDYHLAVTPATPRYSILACDLLYRGRRTPRNDRAV
jgi:hypothetical protein